VVDIIELLPSSLTNNRNPSKPTSQLLRITSSLSTLIYHNYSLPIYPASTVKWVAPYQMAGRLRQTRILARPVKSLAKTYRELRPKGEAHAPNQHKTEGRNEHRYASKASYEHASRRVKVEFGSLFHVFETGKS